MKLAANSPSRTSPTNKQNDFNARQSKWNAFCFMIAAFFVGVHVTTLLHWQQNLFVHMSTTETSAAAAAEAPAKSSFLKFSSLTSTNDNNNNKQKWASLSSSFPPPRKTPAHRTLEQEMTALGNWHMQTLAAVSSGELNPLCSSGNQALTAKCQAMNVKVAKQLQKLQEASSSSSSFLTRRTTGYNFKDFNIVVGNDLITIEQLSSGYEKILQGLKLHSASTFMGVSNQQDPSDAVVIGDLLWRVQPDLVIELGTSGGGSAFYYAHIMQRYNPSARLLTIDPAAGVHDGIPLRQWNDLLVQIHCPFCQHSTTMNEWRRDDSGPIRFHRGFPDSTEALSIASAAAAEAKTVLIIEDSNHLFDSVSKNIQAYHDLVTPGSYFLVQDTRLGEPHRAIQQFLDSKNGACFDVDKRWEYFIFSQHFDGFLRRRESCTTNK